MSAVRVVDLFAGAGGASTGLMLAAHALRQAVRVSAINHWPAAVKTHAANHPEADHLCASVEHVDPREVVPGGRVHLLMAGPECIFFSSARGGKPVNDQRRSSAWQIQRWAELLDIDHILVENVPEFQAWGPLGSDGRPLKRRKGEIYQAWLRALEAMNYRVEARVLNAADFGEATTRQRLFVQARKGRGLITWPEPTHAKAPTTHLFGQSVRWRAAREIIDWSVPSTSIFRRKRPLSPNTLRRIEAGLKRFGGDAFVLPQQSGGAPRETGAPLPTVACGGAIGLCEPFILPPRHMNVGDVDSLERPLRTITASAGHVFGLVEPFLVPMYGERPGQAPRTHGVDEPVPTIPATGGGKFGLVEPFVVTMRGTEPSHLDASASSDDPLRTVSASGTHHGLVEPFIVTPGGANLRRGRSVNEPLPTVTCSERFALVLPDGMDIRFRMLQPHELAAAMGFPSDYQFLGTKGDVIRMIGNAWSVRVAQALCETILARWTVTPRSRRRRAA